MKICWKILKGIIMASGMYLWFAIIKVLIPAIGTYGLKNGIKKYFEWVDEGGKYVSKFML